MAELGAEVHSLSRTGSPVVGSPVAMERDTAQLSGSKHAGLLHTLL